MRFLPLLHVSISLFLFGVLPLGAAEPQRRILVVYANSQQLPGIALFDEEFRHQIRKIAGDSVDVLNEFMDIDRHPRPSYEAELADFLREKYRNSKLDVIVTNRLPALRFVLDHRAYFPSAPIIYTGIHQGEVASMKLPHDVYGVPLNYEPAEMLATALRLHPGTQQVIVITGISEIDRFWERLTRETFRPLEGPVQINYWTRLPMVEIMDRLHKPLDNTIIFTPGILQDGSGQLFVTLDVIEQISRVSARPVYAENNMAIGRGAVGAYTPRTEDIGRQTANLAHQLINRVPGIQIELPAPVPNQFIFDWRQLQRFGVRVAALPKESQLLFRKPRFWEAYKWQVIIIILVSILQTALIVILLTQRRLRTGIERQLRQGEERFRLMIESMPNALLMFDAKGAIVMVNSRADALFGYTRRQLIGFPFEKLFPERYRYFVFEESEVWSANGSRELYCTRQDAQEFPVELGLTPVRTREGNLILASIIDITEKRKAEVEAERQRQQLMHLGRVEMMSHLSGSIAHEINQPLSAIMTNSQVAKRLLEKSPPDLKELKEVMEDVITDNRRASDIVRRLRGWLKKEGPKLAQHDLSSIVEDVVHFLRGELIFHKVACVVQLDSTLPPVHCDKIQIQQVLVNLIKNALEANSAAANDVSQIVIRAEEVENSVQVSVQNDGERIPDSKLKEIFHPFVTTKKEGLGIGLPICRTIIESHSGRIWVQNNREGGCTFHFTLPTPVRELA